MLASHVPSTCNSAKVLTFRYCLVCYYVYWTGWNNSWKLKWFISFNLQGHSRPRRVTNGQAELILGEMCTPQNNVVTNVVSVIPPLCFILTLWDYPGNNHLWLLFGWNISIRLGLAWDVSNVMINWNRNVFWEFFQIYPDIISSLYHNYDYKPIIIVIRFFGLFFCFFLTRYAMFWHHWLNIIFCEYAFV